MDEETQKKWLDRYSAIHSELVEFLRLTERTLREFFLRTGHRTQTIQSRDGQPKSAQSLERKIATLKHCRRLEDIQDLVALRCLFYLDSELNRALNDLAWNLGELGFEKVDYYARRSEDDFNAQFLVLRIASSHPDYDRFKEYKIEVQFTTVLEHTWNEIQHQTIYKREIELSAYDAKSFDRLKTKFGNVMSNHLKEALRVLEHLDSSAKQLIKAREIFQRQNLDEMDSLDDLNQLHSSMSALYDALSENGLKVPPGYDLLALLERTIARASTLKVRPHIVSNWEFKGKESDDVIRKCLEIAKFCRYLDSIRLFDLLRSLWNDGATTNDSVKDVLKSLCRYDLGVLKQIGYSIQFELIDHIEQVSAKELVSEADFFFETLDTFLDLRLEGVERTGIHTYSIPLGAPLPNDALRKIRRNAVSLLIRIYESTTDLAKQLRAIRTLGQAKDLPFTPDGDRDEYRELASEGASQIFDFYLSIYDRCHLVILKEIYKDLADYEQRSGGLAAPRHTELRISIEQNEEFGVYCAFVGYTGDFFRDGMDWREAQNRREQKLEELVASFDDPNSALWQKRFSYLIDARDVLSVGECEGFLQFLRKLSTAKPHIIATISDFDIQRFDRFNYEILIGLSNGEHVNELKSFADRLLAMSVGLDSIASALGFSESLFNHSYRRLIELPAHLLTDDLARCLVNGLATRNKWDEGIIEDCIKLLKQIHASHREVSWIRLLGWKQAEFASQLTETQWIELLDLLVDVPKIDYDEIKMLGVLIEKHPHLLIPFFEKRVRNPKEERADYYYALPSGNGSDLRDAVQPHVKVILPAVLGWFGSDKLRFSAPYLFDDLFSLSDQHVSDSMLELVDKGGERLEIVLSVLQSLSGKVGSQEICKRIVTKHYRNEDVIRTVMSHLMHVGFYHGDDGGLIQMKAFRDSVLAWESTGDTKLQNFQRKFKKFADQLISAEEARIAKERAFEKMEYDDYLDSKKTGNDEN